MLRPKPRTKRIPILGTGFAIIVLVFLFAWSVKTFRAQDKTAPEDIIEKAPLAGILEPSPVTITSASLGEGVRQAELKSLAADGAQGIATRGEKDGHFYFTVTTTLLPIDRETQAYEVWLIRQLPYDFISLGEMVTNDLGQFIREWEPAVPQPGDARINLFADYAGYTSVLITRETKDGNADPGAHVMKGEFRLK